MLSWSAQETGRRVAVDAIVDTGVDPLRPAGRALIALGRSVRSAVPNREAVDSVADELGMPAAIDAAAVAANFQIMNRAVDATGLPIGRRRAEENRELIERLGLDRFPHARH